MSYQLTGGLTSKANNQIYQTNSVKLYSNPAH